MANIFRGPICWGIILCFFTWQTFWGPNLLRQYILLFYMANIFGAQFVEAINSAFLHGKHFSGPNLLGHYILLFYMANIFWGPILQREVGKCNMWTVPTSAKHFFLWYHWSVFNEGWVPVRNAHASKMSPVLRGVDRICLHMKRNYLFSWRVWLSAIFDLHLRFKTLQCSRNTKQCCRNTSQVPRWRHKSANPFICWAKLWDGPCGRSIYSSKFTRRSHFVSKLAKSWHIGQVSWEKSLERYLYIYHTGGKSFGNIRMLCIQNTPIYFRFWWTWGNV